VTGLGIIGGAILRAQQKKILARFHDFLKLPMFEKPISFLRKVSVLQKVFSTKNSQQIENTFGFAKTLSVLAKLFKSVLKVFCRKTLLRLTI
jgi:hypothetical protein